METQNSLQQQAICLICDQTFETFKLCCQHIETIHFLQNPIQDYHYQSMNTSKKGSISSHDKAKTKAATVKNIHKEENTPVHKTTNKADAENPQIDETAEVGRFVHRDRHHEFEQRTRRLLNADAKSFLQACCTLIVQLDREKFVEVSKQYGDKLLNDVQVLYQRVELARKYCLEALDQHERLEDKYTKYMQIMSENLCTVKRVHQMYFEEQEEIKTSSQQQIQSSKSQTQALPQNIQCSVPEFLIKPNIFTEEKDPRTLKPEIQPTIPTIDPASPPAPLDQNQNWRDPIQPNIPTIYYPDPASHPASLDQSQNWRDPIQPSIPTICYPDPASHPAALDQSQNWRNQIHQPNLFQQHQLGYRTPTATQANKYNDKCILCNKKRHRYQLYCKQLKNMTPNQIYKVMTTFGIDCKMCLRPGHKTKNCQASKEGLLKKCHVKEDGKECQKYHCKYLHKHKTEEDKTKSHTIRNQNSNNPISHDNIDPNFDKIQKQFQQMFKICENHKTKNQPLLTKSIIANNSRNLVRNQSPNNPISHEDVEDLNHGKIHNQFQQILKFIENHRTKYSTNQH